MRFLPELKDFLRGRRVIYTVRGYDMRRAGVVIEGVGPCRRIPLGKIYSREELGPFVISSGFSSLREWCNTINDFVAPGQDRWLYRIEVI